MCGAGEIPTHPLTKGVCVGGRGCEGQFLGKDDPHFIVLF